MPKESLIQIKGLELHHNDEDALFLLQELHPPNHRDS